jgi:hypothetical protein
MTDQLKFETYERELLEPLRGHVLSDLESYIASLLLGAKADRPIGINEIIVHVELALDGLRVDDRQVKNVIRSLRKNHAFPILSRKGKPSGYWWCDSVDEMQNYIEQWKAQPLDELHTLSVIVKQNYPALAGQLKLEEASSK